MTTILIVVIVEQKGILCYTLLEIAEILLRRRSPAGLGNGNQTRKSKILKQIVTLYMLGPESTLHTNVVLLQFSRNISRNRNIVIGLLHSVITVSGTGRLSRVGALLAVYIIRSPWGYHRVHAIFGSFACAWLHLTALPTHHHTACTLDKFLVCALCSEALVPHNHSALLVTLLRGYIVRNLTYKMRLQLANIAVAHLLHKSLTLGIALPSTCRCLVATDMYLMIREHLNHLIDDILYKLHCLRIGNVKHVAEDTAVHLYAVRTIWPAAEFRIRCVYSTRVSRKFHLGHHLNVTLSRVSHNIAALILSVEIWTIRLICVISAIHRIDAP